MSSKLTNTGLQLPGTTTVEQTKAVVSVEGNTPNTSGQITLSSTGQTLNTRVGNLETAQNPTNSSLDTRVTALETAQNPTNSSLDTRVTALEGSSGGSNVEIFYASGNWTKPAGVTRLEIVLVGGGAGGGATSTTYNAGGDTTINFGSGDVATADGGSFTSATISGEGGYLGSSGQSGRYDWYLVSLVGGYGNGYNGGQTPGANGDPLGWGGGASGQYPSTYGGDGAGPSSALLGGSGASSGGVSYGGDGKLGGGGSYSSSASSPYPTVTSGGGGGAGAGGGGGSITSGSVSNTFTTYYYGGAAGQVITFFKDVPSQSQTYSIVIGSGGDGLYTYQNIAGGGGGQGIVIIKY